MITILMDDSFLTGETTMNMADLAEMILALQWEGGGYFICWIFNVVTVRKNVLNKQKLLVLLCLAGLLE